MPDNSTAASEAASETQPQAGEVSTPQPQAGNTTAPEPQAGEGQETISLEDAKKLRSEASNLRSRLKAAEAKAAELDQLKAEAEASKLSEAEKLQKKLADLQASHDSVNKQLQERTVSYEVKLQAAQQGLEPTLAAKLVSTSEVTFDEDGSPNNIAELLKSLIKTYPNLVSKQQAPTSGGATNPARSSTSGATQINEQFVRDVLSGKLPHDTYIKLAPEQRVQFLNVQQSMSRR